MGLQKYRADKAGATQSDGATPWYAEWIGGPSLSVLRDAPTEWGPRTVYITGEADTFFSVPAACIVASRLLRGFVTTEDRGGAAEYVFRPWAGAAEDARKRIAARKES